jgi:uncharacterized protein YjbI with pentapeptide repeats
MLQQRLDAWASEARHELIGPFDSVALTGADVSWLAGQFRGAAAGAMASLLLQGARLQNTDLEGADLRGAHLERASLFGAHLRGANLYGAHLEGASCEAADLQGADLAGAQVEGVNFNGARLQGTVLAGVEIRPPTPLVKGGDSRQSAGLTAFSVLAVLALLGLCVVTPAIYLAASVSGQAVLVIGVSYGLGALAIIGAGIATVRRTAQPPRRAPVREVNASDTPAGRTSRGVAYGQRPTWHTLGLVSGLVTVLLSSIVTVSVTMLPECGGAGADVCGALLLPAWVVSLVGSGIAILAAIARRDGGRRRG